MFTIALQCFPEPGSEYLLAIHDVLLPKESFPFLPHGRSKENHKTLGLLGPQGPCSVSLSNCVFLEGRQSPIQLMSPEPRHSWENPILTRRGARRESQRLATALPPSPPVPLFTVSVASLASGSSALSASRLLLDEVCLLQKPVRPT